jgi:hypothetical protein
LFVFLEKVRHKGVTGSASPPPITPTPQEQHMAKKSTAARKLEEINASYARALRYVAKPGSTGGKMTANTESHAEVVRRMNNAARAK